MNPMDMLKNLQSQFGDMQSRLNDVRVAGTSGGDMVRIEMNGKMEMLKISISPEAVDPDDRTMLEDLILAAYNDAFAKIREQLGSQFSSMAGGMGLPPGFMGS